MEQIEKEDSKAKNITNIDISISGTLIKKDISEILEKKVVTDNR